MVMAPAAINIDRDQIMSGRLRISSSI